jgi:hypothetical protein
MVKEDSSVRTFSSITLNCLPFRESGAAWPLCFVVPDSKKNIKKRVEIYAMDAFPIPYKT